MIIISENNLNIEIIGLSRIMSSNYDFEIFNVSRLVKYINHREGPRLVYGRSVSVSPPSSEDIKSSYKRSLIRFVNKVGRIVLSSNSNKENTHLNRYSLNLFKRYVVETVDGNQNLSSIMIVENMRVFVRSMEDFFSLGSIPNFLVENNNVNYSMSSGPLTNIASNNQQS